MSERASYETCECCYVSDAGVHVSDYDADDALAGETIALCADVDACSERVQAMYARNAALRTER